MWFRKGKNVFNFYNIQTKYPNAKLNTKSNNSFSITNIGNWAYALLNLNLKPNTIYTLSADVTNSNGAYCGFYIDNNIDTEKFNYLCSAFDNDVNINVIKNKDKEIIQEIDNKINSVKKNTYKNNMSSN